MGRSPAVVVLPCSPCSPKVDAKRLLPPGGAPIADVWAQNFEEERGRLLAVVERCRYAAVDFEFPGVVRPSSAPLAPRSAEERYAELRGSVDSTKPIQLGLALFGKDGEQLGCWQFNLHFDERNDRAEASALRFLRATVGMNLRRHATDGVDTSAVGELLVSSGLVLTEDIRWLTFHGMYDFAYLLRVVTGGAMPLTLAAFDRALDDHFPRRLDIKRYLPRGSLSHLGEEFGLRRQGHAHHGGSDALLTAELFFKISRHVGDAIRDGRLYGLHSEASEAKVGSRAGTGAVADARAPAEAAERHRQILKAQQEAAARQHTACGREAERLWQAACQEAAWRAAASWGRDPWEAPGLPGSWEDCWDYTLPSWRAGDATPWRSEDAGWNAWAPMPHCGTAYFV